MYFAVRTARDDSLEDIVDNALRCSCVTRSSVKFRWRGGSYVVRYEFPYVVLYKDGVRIQREEVEVLVG